VTDCFSTPNPASRGQRPRCSVDYGFGFGPTEKDLLIGRTLDAACKNMAEYFGRPGIGPQLQAELLPRVEAVVTSGAEVHAVAAVDIMRPPGRSEKVVRETPRHQSACAGGGDAKAAPPASRDRSCASPWGRIRRDRLWRVTSKRSRVTPPATRWRRALGVAVGPEPVLVDG
jgi:hypothetical protein